MNYIINRILVPFDFSDNSEEALNTAADIANEHAAEIHLVYIITYEEIGNDSSIYDDNKDLHEKFISLTYSKLAQYRCKLKDKRKVKIKIYTTVGDPVVELVQYARNWKIDLIVTAPKDWSSFKRFFLGSISYQIIKYTSCPVICIPQGYHYNNFDNIMFPIRNVSGVLHKFDFVKPFLKKEDTLLHLVALTKDDTGSSGQDSLDNLLEWKLRARPYCKELTIEMKVSENFAETILNMVNNNKINLVVINATMEKKWYQIFSENYTQRIINHTPTAILCVKAPQEEEKSELSIESNGEYFLTPFTY